MADKIMNSLLIGNGLDIQAGGDDYLNKWIIVRLLAKAKNGKYDVLFMDSEDAKPTLTGDEIVELFNGMVDIANKALENKYDQLVSDYGDKDVIEALNDFKKRYTFKIASIEEIGMEDWVLMLLLFLIEQGDIIDKYEAAKQGFERMVFDSIYCEGNIQRLKMGKSSKLYFSNFDNIFTLNYDNSLEKLTNQPVFHLHGDFYTKSISENPDNAYGYLRKQNGQNLWFAPQYEHCNCNAILDFSGSRKYNFATSLTKAFFEFEKFKEAYSYIDSLEQMLEKFPAEQRDIIHIGIEKNLPCGHNYHFQDFEKSNGTLTIIGLAPQNDSHIFSCINKSNIEKVVFYHYFGGKSDDEVDAEIKTITLAITKPYIIKNIKKVWDEINLSKPNNSTTYTQILLSRKRNDDFLNLFNSLYPNATVSIEDILRQLRSIPVTTEKAICKMMASEIIKEKYHTTPQSEKELFRHFIDFGKTLKIASISPQTLYFLYFINSQTNGKKSKSAKRRK